jgi:hypothetical protein
MQTMDGAGATATQGSVLITSGCHSGLPIPDNWTPETAFELDLPQEMARKKVVGYIGNTGYGWAIRNGIGLTERLMGSITTELLTSGALTVGQALSQAKREYYLQEKRWDVFDEKVMHELTLYGIPNYLIVTSGQGATGGDKEALPSPDGPPKGCADGICLEKTLKVGQGVLPDKVTELELNFTFGSGTYSLVTTPNGNYYTLNDLASGETGDAIQPKFVYDSYLSGTKPHGVLFTGGSYTSEAFTPLAAVPKSTNDPNTGPGPLPSGSGFTPNLRASAGSATSAGFRSIEEKQYLNMVTHTAYYESGIESKYGSMQFVVYYHKDSADFTIPEVTDPGAGGFHTVDGMNASFAVSVSDASGVYRVLVTYDDKRQSRWTSKDLGHNAYTGLWEGTLPLKGDIAYYIQVVDNAGNVGMLTQTGQDQNSGGQKYGSTWEYTKTFIITLPDTDADTLPDAYEDFHPACLSKSVGGQGALDPDFDRLTSSQEFALDTNPCAGDTDGGGDNDGSELNANGTNPKRNPLYQADDKHLTIFVAKNAANYDVTWPAGSGDNGRIDGYYFVYRSDTPFFDPLDNIGTPIADGSDAYTDSAPSCSTCYYNVWNYQLDTQPPYVQAVAPPIGPTVGGTYVSVFGQNFTSGAKVYFDNIQATNITFVNVSMITCTTPAHGAGVVAVKIVNPNAQEGSLVNGFTYQ